MASEINDLPDYSATTEHTARRQGGNYENDIWQAQVEEIRQLLAEGPQTRRSVQLECHHSEKGALRRLNYLIDQGDVKRVENPDDGRRVRYALVGEGEDA